MGKDKKPMGLITRAIARVVFGPKEGRMGSSEQMWSEIDKGKRGGRR
jgi:hypothetical protein